MKTLYSAKITWIEKKWLPIKKEWRESWQTKLEVFGTIQEAQEWCESSKIEILKTATDLLAISDLDSSIQRLNLGEKY
jgi:hypothetical protein